MSWDVYVRTIDEGDLYERNVTYNNSRIFAKALGCPFRDLDHKIGRTMLPRLNKAIADLTQHREEYLPLEPANGWGGIDDVLAVLRGIREACEDYPAATIIVH